MSPSSFTSLEIANAPHSDRFFPMRKAEAMLIPATEYVTWVDADGFFVGNCSDMLAPTRKDGIHVRVRGVHEFEEFFQEPGLSSPKDPSMGVPVEWARSWARDVGVPESTQPRINCGVSSCFLSVHRSQRLFLERWDRQITSVFSGRRIRSFLKDGPYRLIDEPVLSSLLMYLSGAPTPTEFQLDKREDKMFYHIVGVPKPWVWWSPHTWRFHDKVMDIIRWARERGFIEPPLPLSLNPDREWIHKPTLFFSYGIRAASKFKKNLLGSKILVFLLR